jgi:hypothetical protein
MPKAAFQVAIVFAPGRLISAGVTRGDVDQGLVFLLKLQPLVQRFIQSTKNADVHNGELSDRNAATVHELKNEHPVSRRVREGRRGGD